MRSNTLYASLSGVLLVAACAWFAFPESVADISNTLVRPVKLVRVNDYVQGDIRQFPATVHSAEESMISFRVGGELEQLPVNNAQMVKKGDLLAALDDRDYRNEVALRRADFDLAQSNYQRVKSLWERKVASRSELDSATSSFKSAEVALKLAKDRLKDTKLKAPFDGRVGRIDVENYQLIQPQQTVLLLQNNDLLEVRIQVPENIVTRVRGETVDRSYQPRVSFGANTERFYPVTYKEHATSATPGTLSYEVTLTLKEPEDITVYPGMGATVHLDMSRLFEASDLSGIVVPMTAVLADDATGKPQVWVYNPETGVVNPVEVTLGRITQSGIHILSGLKGNEVVVAAGLSRLKAGMAVKPLTRERGL